MPRDGRQRRCPAVVQLRGKHRMITEPVANARHRVAFACQPGHRTIRLGAVAPRVAMDPDDQRHATGIAAGREVQIKPLPSVGGLARPWLAVGLVAVCRDARGVCRRGHRRSQCGVGRNGRCRALFRRCRWKKLRGRPLIAERWTNRPRLIRHLVERRPSPGAATLGPTGAAPPLRHFHARGGIGCRPGILPPGDGHMRRQEHLHRARVRSGDRVDQQWHDQHRHNEQGSRQQSPRVGCGGMDGVGGRRWRVAVGWKAERIAMIRVYPPMRFQTGHTTGPSDHGPAARAARRARAWNAKATTSGGPASGRSGSVRR